MSIEIEASPATRQSYVQAFYSYLANGRLCELKVSLRDGIVTLEPGGVGHFEVEGGELATKGPLERG